MPIWTVTPDTDDTIPARPRRKPTPRAAERGDRGARRRYAIAESRRMNR